jgi:hypothetical protein
MQFLYPTSRQFPFDEVCSQIVSALEKRNWRAGDLKVTIRDYGSGDQKLRLVSDIEAADFSLHFGRVQRTLPGGNWNDTAAVTRLKIPKKILHVYEDESGPSLWTYVGDNWEADRASFRADFNAKLNNEPRTYLAYKGVHRWQRQRADILKPVEDYREYGPQGGDPRQIDTVVVMEEFNSYLLGVLSSVEAFPLAEVPIDVLAVPPKIPFPAGIGPFFTRADHSDAARIKRGKAADPDLALAHRFGLTPNYRLANLGVRNDGTVPEVAYDGFVWCGLDLAGVSRVGAPGDLVSNYRNNFIVRVTPKDANGIYVADQGALEKRRTELGEAIKGQGQRDHFTDEEVNDFQCARARTIVPITEYGGDFDQPVVLINRELACDEVEIVRELLPGER